MEIILIPAFLICLLYLIFSSAERKKSPEMVKIIRVEAGKTGYGYGGNLPDLLKTEGEK